MEILATIAIGIDPDWDIGPLTISWHGLMTFLAVAIAVVIVARLGTRAGMSADGIYAVAVWAILGGIIGSRFLHVIDTWDIYGHDPVRILYFWQGGVTIYGAILGGFVGGSLYMIIRNSQWFLSTWGNYFSFMGKPVRAPLPGVGHLADICVPALLIAQAIGRVGDIINGEHCAKFTDLAWGVIYTHPERASIACERTFGTGATHPAVAYELLMDLVILAVLWPLRDRLRPRGMFFALNLATYSLGRFFLSFLRTEFSQYGPLNEAQIVALIVLGITIPLLVGKARFVRSGTQAA